MLFSFFYASLSTNATENGDGDRFEMFPKCPSKQLKYDFIVEQKGCEGIVGYNIPMDDIARDWQVTDLSSIAGEIASTFSIDINTVTNWLNLVKWTKNARRAFSTFSLDKLSTPIKTPFDPSGKIFVTYNIRLVVLKTTVIKVTKSERNYYVKARQAAHSAKYVYEGLYKRTRQKGGFHMQTCSCPFPGKFDGPGLFTSSMLNTIYSQVERQINGKIASFLNM